METPKDPATFGVITYLWVVGISALGGVVNFMRKRREGHVRAFNVTEFIGELVASAFVGVLTFWLCEAGGVKPLITAALVGITGHMGSRAIFMFEGWAERRFGGQLPTSPNESQPPAPPAS